MSAMRKKTLLELMQERAEQNLNQQINTSAYTDKPRKSANNNSEIKTKVDSLFQKNQNIEDTSIWNRIKARAENILSNTNNSFSSKLIEQPKPRKSIYDPLTSNLKSNSAKPIINMTTEKEREKEIADINKKIKNAQMEGNELKASKLQKEKRKLEKSKVDIAEISYNANKQDRQNEQQKRLDNAETPLEKGAATAHNVIENIFQKPKALYDGYQVGDLTKIAGITAIGAGSHIIGGIESVANSITQTLGYGSSSVVELLGNNELAVKIKQATQAQQEEHDKTKQTIFGMLDKNSILGETGNQVTEGIGQSTVLGTVGGSNKAAGNVLTALQGFGGSLQDSYSQEDIKGWQALLRASGSGFVSYFSENLFENLGYGGSGIDKALKDKIEKEITDGLGKSLALTGLSATGEGAEEIIETLGNNIVDRAINYITKQVGQGAKLDTDINIEEVIESATIGFLSGGFSEGSVNFANYKNNMDTTSKRDTTIKNNEVLNNNQQIIPDNANMPQNSISERIEGINKSEVELTQENSQKLEKVLQKDKYKKDDKAEKFFKSAIENNLDVSNEKIEALYDLPNARGIKTEFNQKYFEDGNGKIRENINALYITDREGNRSIIYNPKAQENSIIEKNAIHETFHDMAGTRESKEVIDFVYDRIKDSVDFHEAYESLKEAYANVQDADGNILYNKNSKEFENMIKEEAIADYLGTNLGNQEYINELVNGKESRNIAQKIYDAIVSFLDKVTGYKSEEAYLRGLKEKFEKAFNTDFNNQNNNSKLSIGGRNAIENAIKSDKSYKLLEQDYNEAIRLFDEGKLSKEEIRKKTGWSKDRNGDFKFEFSDEHMKLKNTKFKQNKTYNLKDILEHDLLFKYYPELENYKVKFTEKKANGSIDIKEKSIELNLKLLNKNIKNKELKIEGTLIHEIQHAIQDIEGFEGGTSTKRSKLAYYESLGEIEANDTKQRFILEKNGQLDRSMVMPESFKDNPQHSNLNNYLKNRKILDKVKDNIYNYFNSKISEESNYEDYQENIKEDKIQDSSLVDGGRRISESFEERVEQNNRINKELENDSSSFSLPQNENILVNTKGNKIDISNLKETSQMKLNTYNRKYNKENITAYRGVSENTGNNSAMYGLGLYTTLDKNYASKYGDVEIVNNDLLPDNPLKFKTQNDFKMWEQDLASQLGIRYSELLGTDYGIEKYVKKLGYDGLMIGSGKDTDLISFKEIKTKEPDIRYSNSNIGKWEEFLEKYKINDGIRTTLRELKLPEAKRNLPTVQESQYQDIINNAAYIPKEEKASLLAELDGVKKNIKSLREFESIVEEMNNTYKQLDNDLLKKQTYNTGNKEIYQSYLKETKKYDMKAVNNALNLVKPNSQGRRTKEQWTTIARQIGTEISNKSNKDIQEIAFRSWQDLRPNSKENLNRQGQKYVDFNSDDWVNTIYEQVEKSRMKFSINENKNDDIKLPQSKKIESKRVELPTNPKIYQDEDVRAFRYATDNIDNISQEDNFAPPKPQDDNLPDTKSYIKRKRTKEKIKPSEALDSFAQSFVNKGHYIDKLSKQTKNNELKYKYDRTLSTFNEAQHSIGKEQVNSKGEVVGESLLDIFKPIENAKLEEDFEDYLLNKHNISRSIVGKSIYGDDVSAPQSKRKVEIYEQKYPQFKEWSEKVSKYNQNTLKDMADTGMISQDTYSNLRTMYGDYVPTYRDIINEKVIFDEDNKVGSNALGKATASNLEILSPKEAMAEQTLTVKKAIRMNELGVELYKTLGKGSKVFEGIDFDATAIQTLAGDVIQKAQDGSNTFTIFIDGKMTQFKISDDLYTAFSKDTIQEKIRNKKALKALNTYLLTPIEKLSKAQRDLLTTYSIGFAVNNPLKDIQDAVFNTKYSVARFGKNYVKALYQMGTKGKLYKQYLRDGGASNTYFEYDKGLLPQKNRIKKTIDKVQILNSTLEMAPRLAEYISTLEKGGTKAEAMYNAAEITTNFKRGGDITKAMNKYGANFLNASVQGLDKQIRNLSGENGIKGYARLVARTAMLGVLPSILNHLLLDDDEDYQDLPDYIKDSYYLIPSSKEDDKFIRIPKGRILATIGTTARNMLELAEGERNIEEAISGSLGGVVKNMAPNNPVTDNLVAPIIQATTNKAWYDGEIESSRLQKLPVAERTDEKTDEISNKISEALQSNSLTKYIADKIGISPKKINYVIDQYSGGIGDVLLPMSTPYAETNIFEDKFTTSSVLKNKNVENFYTALENAELSKNSAYATDTDQLEYQYLSNVSKDVGDLYKEKRDIQSSNLSDNEKKQQTKEIQTQINNIVKETLSTLESAEITSTTANFNGIQYYKDEEDKWNKIKEEEIPKGLSTKTYADYKNKLAVATERKRKKENDEDVNLTSREKADLLKTSTYTVKEKKEIYSEILGKNDKDYKILSKLEDINIDAYLDYKTQEFKADDDPNSDIIGKTVSGSKKANLINYLNSSNLSPLDKLYILGKSNKLDYQQRLIIYNEVNKSNLTLEEKKEFYTSLSSSNIVEYEDGSYNWK